MLVTNCATGSLAVYEPSPAVPWNRLRAQHLYRRLGFGADAATIETALARRPADLVDELLTKARNEPLFAPPEWADWSYNDYTDFNNQLQEQAIDFARIWANAMLAGSVRENFSLFWHNHLVTKFETYLCPSYLYQYHRLLQRHALGNFRAMVEEVGKTPAMLIFLNGVQNNALQPNENYARELYELFTLGRDNGYTQADIVNTARALTGWNGFTTLCEPIGYLPWLHDQGNKTIFGRTGNWDYDDVHDILFSERAQQISHYICTKLYRHYIHPEVDESIVAGLAATFRNANWEIAPVLRQLFQSEHFFDEAVVAVQIKSPVNLFIQYIREAGYPFNEYDRDVALYIASQLGQQFFNPPDVAGWPGHRAWVNTNTLTGRWQGIDYYLLQAFQQEPASLVELAKQLAGENATDPYLVTQELIDYFVPKGLPDNEAYERATAVFKWQIPQNYFDTGQWNLYWDTVATQVALLLRHISRLPEFQLS